MVSLPQIDPNLLYPDSDGQPIAENTAQYEWIVILKENLEILFAAAADVFIAADLLWYPVQSRLIAPTAPDVMVAFGRPKGRRGSYQQWQEANIPPQVIFEILSPSNTAAELSRKLEFYDTYGVEEYYLYDPDTNCLQGWLRQDGLLVELASLENWVSPRLGIRFVSGSDELEVYRPDGGRFLTSIELHQRLEAERQRAETAEDQIRQTEELLARYRSQFGDLPE